jgi:hypothetical protein
MLVSFLRRESAFVQRCQNNNTTEGRDSNTPMSVMIASAERDIWPNTNNMTIIPAMNECECKFGGWERLAG